MTLDENNPTAVALVGAIQGGQIASLEQLLRVHPGLASEPIVNKKRTSRTPLHIVTDWPGYFPNGPDTARLLLDAGADPNAAIVGGRFPETPLHSAASSDDLEVAEVLIGGGADVDAPGACIGGGPPLADAVAFGCWHVARLLVARGARVDTPWQAAALGMTVRVEELLDTTSEPLPEEINHAFWQACHGGQRHTAEYLFARGADVNWVPDHTDATPLDMCVATETRRELLATWLREHGATSAHAPGP
ncbi:MAG: ankyrin repeat domain-containing protein [Acidimicrobiia bacterium]